MNLGRIASRLSAPASTVGPMNEVRATLIALAEVIREPDK